MDISWKLSSTFKTAVPHQQEEKTESKMFVCQLDGAPIYVLQNKFTRNLMVGKANLPGRLLLGMERGKDLGSATYTIACSEEFKNELNTKYNPEKESISAMLIREPLIQAPFLNAYLGSGYESRLYAVMDVHHVEDEAGIKGLSGRVCDYRIDVPESKADEIHNSIKVGVLYDSIAGGRNLLAAAEDLKNKFPNLEKFVFVSVYSTIEGSRRIIKACKEMNITPIFFCMHELLTASPINEYDCYYPDWNISKEDEELMTKFYGKNFREMQMGGDWTANSLGKEQSIEVLKIQLKTYGMDADEFVSKYMK